jgi:multiple sugar transport system ATP-binding protein
VEALTMSTKIAVMRDGVIQQLDVPDKVYHFPANIFVADFIGNPKVNLLDGEIRSRNSVDLGKFNVNVETHNATGKVVVGVRPEDIVISDTPIPGGVEFRAYSVLPAGADTTIVALIDELEVTIKVMGISQIKMDDKIWLKFEPKSLNLYDKETGDMITS